MLDERALARKLHAETIQKAIEVGERMARFAEKYRLFEGPTPLSRVLHYLRPRMLANNAGVFVSSNAVRIRRDALFLAVETTRKNLPSMQLVIDRVPRHDVEFVRRITEDEQRHINLERDRQSVDRLVHKDERRISQYLAERARRPAVRPRQMKLEV